MNSPWDPQARISSIDGRFESTCQNHFLLRFCEIPALAKLQTNVKPSRKSGTGQKDGFSPPGYIFPSFFCRSCWVVQLKLFIYTPPRRFRLSTQSSLRAPALAPSEAAAWGRGVLGVQVGECVLVCAVSSDTTSICGHFHPAFAALTDPPFPTRLVFSSFFFPFSFFSQLTPFFLSSFSFLYFFNLFSLFFFSFFISCLSLLPPFSFSFLFPLFFSISHFSFFLYFLFFFLSYFIF